MPHATIRLKAGVSEVTTPTLNEAMVNTSQLIRFFVDPTYGPLIQKLGGWQKYFPNVLPSIVRALWGWEDTDAVAHLGVGCQNVGVTSSAYLCVITNGSIKTITPTETTDNVAVNFSTTSGSSTVIITDATTTGITDFDVVYIETHVSVGGLILFGLYQCMSGGPTTYTIQAMDALGNPEVATATVANGGAVAKFSTTLGSGTVKVTLNNHGFSVGDTYACLVSTTVGGVTLYGNYVIQSVIDADNFQITAANTATSTTTGFINGGNVRFVYSIGFGPIARGSGFGTGGFGRGGFGVGSGVTPAMGSAVPANDWTLDNWGEILLSCPINGTIFQPIYAFDPLAGQPTATIIPQAPPVNDGFFVAMPQRQIIAWGSTLTGIQDPLLIRWCDVNNFNVWIGTINNQAGYFRLPRGSRIVGGMQAPQQGLIWTDLGVWSMQYIGPDEIYSFNEIAYGCGLITRKATGVLNGIVYWMGPTQFYSLSGDGVTTIPCSVWDVVFQNLDTANVDKIRCAVNARFGEISWFFPSLKGNGEVDTYVKYNAICGAWDYGSLSRTAWIDQSVLGPPIGADPGTLYIYQHETSNDADGQPLVSNFQTGYASLSDGDVLTYVDQMWPDMVWGDYGQIASATIQITFFIADYPGATPRQIGPYSVTQATKFISPRFRARLVGMQIGSSDLGSFWRIGAIRHRYCEDGKF